MTGREATLWNSLGASSLAQNMRDDVDTGSSDEEVSSLKEKKELPSHDKTSVAVRTNQGNSDSSSDEGSDEDVQEGTNSSSDDKGSDDLLDVNLMSEALCKAQGVPTPPKTTTADVQEKKLQERKARSSSVKHRHKHRQVKATTKKKEKDAEEDRESSITSARALSRSQSAKKSRHGRKRRRDDSSSSSASSGDSSSSSSSPETASSDEGSDEWGGKENESSDSSCRSKTKKRKRLLEEVKTGMKNSEGGDESRRYKDRHSSSLPSRPSVISGGLTAAQLAAGQVVSEHTERMRYQEEIRKDKDVLANDELMGTLGDMKLEQLRFLAGQIRARKKKELTVNNWIQTLRQSSKLLENVSPFIPVMGNVCKLKGLTKNIEFNEHDIRVQLELHYDECDGNVFHIPAKVMLGVLAMGIVTQTHRGNVEQEQLKSTFQQFDQQHQGNQRFLFASSATSNDKDQHAGASRNMHFTVPVASGAPTLQVQQPVDATNASTSNSNMDKSRIQTGTSHLGTFFQTTGNSMASASSIGVSRKTTGQSSVAKQQAQPSAFASTTTRADLSAKRGNAGLSGQTLATLREIADDTSTVA